MAQALLLPEETALLDSIVTTAIVPILRNCMKDAHTHWNAVQLHPVEEGSTFLDVFPNTLLP